jgi:hypothetical protein
LVPDFGQNLENWTGLTPLVVRFRYVFTNNPFIFPLFRYAPFGWLAGIGALELAEYGYVY